MDSLRSTLLADGTSDRALLAVLSWALVQLGLREAQPALADLRGLLRPPRTLGERARVATELYPCDVLFVHRDAEKVPWADRRSEITRAVEDLGVPHVAVIPVRMTEAWLMLDPDAIRRAASNPGGKTPLRLPSINRLATLPDPKDVLYELLRKASGLTGRRLASFRPQQSVYTLSREIADFGPLRRLDAFREFEDELTTFAASHRALTQDVNPPGTG